MTGNIAQGHVMAFFKYSILEPCSQLCYKYNVSSLQEVIKPQKEYWFSSSIVGGFDRWHNHLCAHREFRLPNAFRRVPAGPMGQFTMEIRSIVCIHEPS